MALSLMRAGYMLSFAAKMSRLVTRLRMPLAASGAMLMRTRCHDISALPFVAANALSGERVVSYHARRYYADATIETDDGFTLFSVDGGARVASGARYFDIFTG